MNKRGMMVAALIAVAIGTWVPVITMAASYLFVSDNGSVGIGNVDPQAKLDVSGAIYSRLVSVTNSSTVDWSQGNVQEVTLSSNATLNFTNGVPGAEYKLILKQDTVGGRTVTWPPSVKWLVQANPSVSTGANIKDVVSFVYDGADYLGTFAAAVGQSGGQGGGQSGECTGGTITHAGGNTIHTFTDVGTSTFSCANAGEKTVNYLVVAGGGGGGTGGGGAGGVREGTLAVDAQSYSVTVGQGGLGQSTTQTRANGENSTFSSITAVGGGAGGYSSVGGNGGSGGGGSRSSNAGGNFDSSGLGHAGGQSGPDAGAWASGGGGGAGSSGEAADAWDGGYGGSGFASSISGSPVTYAGGGGGGADSGHSGSGGSGGGGAGVSGGGGNNGTPNTGSGGGGNNNINESGDSAGNGGSGIVIISYPTP